MAGAERSLLLFRAIHYIHRFALSFQGPGVVVVPETKSRPEERARRACACGERGQMQSQSQRRTQIATDGWSNADGGERDILFFFSLAMSQK